MNHQQMRTWAEISLDNIAHNFRALTRSAGDGCTVLGVVKANAYGHGAREVAGALQQAGCRYLAVATLDEALELRESGITLPILILGWTDPRCTLELIENNITQAVSDETAAREMSRIAADAGLSLKVHLKVDSGMGRLGFICRGQDPADTLCKILALPGLAAEGIFTHFAVSELADSPYTAEQFHDFMALADRVEKQSGKKFAMRHCANSGAVVSHPDMKLDMVRPGIALYGLYPGDDRGGLDLRPALSMKTRIYQIKELSDGATVSYGRRHTVAGTRRIAVVPVGYADGLHRVLSGRIHMLVHGKAAPQCGSICMDMCMLDVTDIPEAAVGDVVTIIGQDGEASISADELAEKAGTISYEMLCSLSPRVPRIYR